MRAIRHKISGRGAYGVAKATIIKCADGTGEIHIDRRSAGQGTGHGRRISLSIHQRDFSVQATRIRVTLVWA